MRIVHSLGFRPARPNGPRQIPGVVDYFAPDLGIGKVIHIHAHYRLVLGDDISKNYRLPIESAYIASASDDGSLPVPAPEFEYVLLILRMALKHCPWDAQLARKGG